MALVAIADRDGVSMAEVAERGPLDLAYRMAYLEWRNKAIKEAQ